MNSADFVNNIRKPTERFRLEDDCDYLQLLKKYDYLRFRLCGHTEQSIHHCFFVSLVFRAVVDGPGHIESVYSETRTPLFCNHHR